MAEWSLSDLFMFLRVNTEGTTTHNFYSLFQFLGPFLSMEFFFRRKYEITRKSTANRYFLTRHWFRCFFIFNLLLNSGVPSLLSYPLPISIRAGTPSSRPSSTFWPLSPPCSPGATRTTSPPPPPWGSSAPSSPPGWSSRPSPYQSYSQGRRWWDFLHCRHTTSLLLTGSILKRFPHDCGFRVFLKKSFRWKLTLPLFRPC